MRETLGTAWDELRGYSRQRVVSGLGRGLLHFLYRNRPIPLFMVELVRKLAGGEDGIRPKFEKLTTGQAIKNPFLSKWLRDTELGSWALSAATLNFLEQQIATLKPARIVEFGGGVSTVCLARYMLEAHDEPNRVYVFSVDQDPQYVNRTRLLVKSAELEQNVVVDFAPVIEQRIEDVDTSCYSLPAGFTEAVRDCGGADMLFIDGPAGDGGVRFGTLLLARQMLTPEAWFFLDDALRDAELKLARAWKKMPWVRVHGITLVGKGVLVGRLVEGPR